VRRATVFVVAALGLVVAAQAGAHAEIGPEEVPAGSVSTFVLSVEGEEAVPTTQVAMQVPRGVSNVRPSPASGWQVNRSGRVVTWTGGSIQQGESFKFEISARFPNAPGRTLVFPVVQTYANGTVVRWIGTQASETPAPRISLTAAVPPPPPPPPPPAAAPPAAPPPPVATITTPTTTTDAESDDDGDSTGWIVGVVIAAILAGSGIALLWRRRR
jgi:uncharacterized protein YcnI